jgi:C4-type Zn-finger protein
MGVWGYEVLCPRCRTSMEYMSEVERSGEVVVSYFYRCPACGFRVLDERVAVKGLGDGLLLEVHRHTGRKLLVLRSLRASS